MVMVTVELVDSVMVTVAWGQSPGNNIAILDSSSTPDLCTRRGLFSTGHSFGGCRVKWCIGQKACYPLKWHSILTAD